MRIIKRNHSPAAIAAGVETCASASAIVVGSSFLFSRPPLVSGEESDVNYGDTFAGQGSGDDVLVSADGDDQSTGNGGRDILFVCGDGEEDTVTDFNEAEGDIAAPDCENI